MVFAVVVAASGCRGESRQAPRATSEASEASEASKARATSEANEASEVEDVEALTRDAHARTDRFQAELKAELLGAMEGDGGPVEAIAVCRERAPAIAAAMSEDGWVVGRTAARLRNPTNAPNEWQRRGLADLQQRAAGDNPDIAALEWHEIERGPEGKRLLYMRAIPMGGLCLGCHGPAEGLDPAVRDQLASLYPEDEATGFAVGELRGAFVVSKTL
ncbi:hypothetical protein ENSA5_33550 [Enhygromyxa salina]|uniref:Tll0287-like domain-containing protein n=1 Tax=Enhygromyxa salina TaxID=215803 RepID=A0A2S9XXC5_9BACT|nr:DUF3365 domain-containing protein [Enhygromyxa salina]PRP97519.1 hypothetical protein ENSA5_33550 [Enhygromyxa salina]